jgi:hypothetical protein
VDTTNDSHFARKLNAAVAAAGRASTETTSTTDVLDRLQIAKAYDAKAASATLDALTRVLRAQKAAYEARSDALVLRTRMIVVDTVTDLFAPELKEKSGLGENSFRFQYS